MEWITSSVKAVANRFFYGAAAAAAAAEDANHEEDHHEEEEEDQNKKEPAAAEVNGEVTMEVEKEAVDDDNVAFTSSLLSHPSAPACNVAVAAASLPSPADDRKRKAVTTSPSSSSPPAVDDDGAANVMEIQFDDDDSDDEDADDADEVDQQGKTATANNAAIIMSTQTSYASAATTPHSNLSTSTSQQQGSTAWTKQENDAFLKAIELYGYNFELVSEEIGTKSKDEVRERAVRALNYQPGDIHQKAAVTKASVAVTATAAAATAPPTPPPPPPPPTSSNKKSTPTRRKSSDMKLMQLGRHVSPRGRRSAQKKKRQAAEQAASASSSTPATKKRRGRPPSSTNKTKTTPGAKAAAADLKPPPPTSSTPSKTTTPKKKKTSRIGRPPGSKNMKTVAAEAAATSGSVKTPASASSSHSSRTRLPRNAMDLVGRRFAKSYARTTYFGTIVSYDPNTAKFTLHFDEDADVLILTRQSLKKHLDKYEERKDWDVVTEPPITIEQLLEDPELPIHKELGIAKYVMLLKGKDGEDARAWQGKNQPGQHALVSGDVEEYIPPANANEEPRWNVLLQEVKVTEDGNHVEQGAVIEQELNAAEIVHCARIFKKLAARGASE